jgi:hypothetical protein
VDFDYQNQLGAVAFNPASTSLGTWDNAYWDQQTWGGLLSINRIWQGVTGLGFAGGINMSLASQGIDVHWVATDYVMEKGGVLSLEFSQVKVIIQITDYLVWKSEKL